MKHCLTCVAIEEAYHLPFPCLGLSLRYSNPLALTRDSGRVDCDQYLGVVHGQVSALDSSRKKLSVYLLLHQSGPPAAETGFCIQISKLLILPNLT